MADSSFGSSKQKHQNTGRLREPTWRPGGSALRRRQRSLPGHGVPCAAVAQPAPRRLVLRREAAPTAARPDGRSLVAGLLRGGVGGRRGGPVRGGGAMPAVQHLAPTAHLRALRAGRRLRVLRWEERGKVPGGLYTHTRHFRFCTVEIDPLYT